MIPTVVVNMTDSKDAALGDSAKADSPGHDTTTGIYEKPRLSIARHRRSNLAFPRMNIQRPWKLWTLDLSATKIHRQKN